MAGNDIRLMMRIQADVKQAVREMRRISGELEKQGRSGQKTAKKLDEIGPAYRRMAQAAGAYLTVASAISALKIADEFQLIEARLRRATQAQGDYNQVSQSLFAIAQRNGSALKDTADLFININRAAADLGLTRDQILAVTNALQQLGVLSGASATEMSNALRQFSQAMAGGVLRAEEFNSIVENTPEIANRIARGMDMTVGQLRLAVIEGRVLSRDVMQSLLSQVTEINREFQSAPQSLEASANRLANAWGAMLTRIDDALNVTTTLKTLMDAIAAIMEDMAGPNESRLVQLQKERLRLFARQREIQREIAELEERANGAIGHRRRILTDKVRALRKEARELQQQILDNQVLLTAENSAANERARQTPATPPAPVKPKSTGVSEEEKRRKAIERSIESLRLEADTYGMSAEQVALYRLEMQGATQAQLALARAAIEDIQAEREFEAANKAAQEAAKQQTIESQRLNAELDAQAQRWRDLINPVNQYQRQIEELERLYNAGKISAETYAEATFRIQDAIEKVGEKAKDAGDGINEFAKQAARNIQDQLGDTLYNIADTSFKGILRSWVDMLRKMANEALAAQIGKKLLGENFGKTGDLGGILGSILGAIFHDGGIVGEGGQTRRVSPLLFAAAERYHTGGFPGLMPGEVPAIIQRGEEVLTRSDPRNALNGGAQAAKPQVRIVNVIDPAMVQDYMTSSSGEDAILNVLSRRRSDLQAIVS